MARQAFRMMPAKWFPRPHEFSVNTAWTIDSDDGGTNFPILMYDEGQGDPTSYNSNPHS